MHTGWIRRTAVAVPLAAVVATMSVGAGLATPETSAQPSPPGLERFYDQRLLWGPCAAPNLRDAGAQCADVMVPLDYSDPGGRTITVAISRLQATDPARRRGVMLTNPGGPGGVGLDFTLVARKAMAPDVRARYDLIGMDPRGVGRSRPVHCVWPVPTMFSSAGPDLASYGRDVALEAALAAGCLGAGQAALRFVTTRNTARDMDVVRAALGERKINYYGISYGTYLGAVYTQMFAQHSDRFVLDSALDPDRYWLGTVQDMGGIGEASLDDWAKWVAAREARYRLGATAGQVRAAVEGLIRRASAGPIVIEGVPLDEHLMPVVMFELLSDSRLNGLLADIVQKLVYAVGGHAAPLSPRDHALMRRATTEDGSAMAAIVCGDVAMPRDPAWYWRNIEGVRGAQPVFGAFANNIEPCAFWPAPVEPATLVRNAVPALILQSTRDPRTAYPEGLALHRDMAASRMITLRDVRIHVTFRPGLSSCLNDAVNEYFRNGTLPHSDITCQAAPHWMEQHSNGE